MTAIAWGGPPQRHRALHAADGRRETVDDAEAGVKPGHSAEEAGPRHLFAGVAICRSPRREAAHGRRGAAFDATGRSWVGADTDVGFDQLGERVEAGGGGDRARQSEGQLGIDHARAAASGAAQAGLDAMLSTAEDRMRVTSLPVPAVVGMAMQGAAGTAGGRPRPITSR